MNDIPKINRFGAAERPNTREFRGPREGGSKLASYPSEVIYATAVYNCAHEWPLGHKCEGNSRRKLTTLVG